MLSRFQHFTLDAAAPIIGILDQLASGEPVDHDVLQTGSLKLDLFHLVFEDLFDEAAPNFFGFGFAKVAKERSDAMSALRQAKSKPNTNPFFEKGAPHPTRARGTRRLAILGSSPARNAGDTTRAIRGTRAFKAITAIKASTRARVNPPNFNPPTNRSSLRTQVWDGWVTQTQEPLTWVSKTR